MTLDEMLALLPDNDSGEITAADLRTIITELYQLASTVGQNYSYSWSTADLSPGSGKVGMDLDWADTATKVLMSEITSDGESLTFAMLDSALEAQVWISTGTDSRLKATVTGPSLDQGGYRELPVEVYDVHGPAPANNAKVSVTLLVMLG